MTSARPGCTAPGAWLSARLLAELAEVLRAAAERARERGAAVTAAHSIEIADTSGALEAFARAERLGEPRFYAVHPHEDFELVGVGAARSCALHGAGPRELREAARDWLDPLEVHPSAAPPIGSRGPFIASGLAFEPRPQSARSPEWAAFASGAAALPELALERRRSQCRLHLAASLPAERSARGDPVARAMARFEALLGKADLARAAAATPLRAQALAAADDGAYRSALVRMIEAIARGEARKVVLARAEELRVRGRIDVPETLRALRERERHCLTFAYGLGARSFIGASPERLMRRAGSQIETWAVAATAARGGSADERSALARGLRGSAKQREEHALVVEGIERSLAPLCGALDVPAEPSLLETGTLQHLRTRVRGELRAPAHILDLVGALHPTAAIAGTPRSAALELIRAHEALDRGWYAGPIGWFDAQGEGDFFVALRCALIEGSRVRLFAGSGLLAGSQPADEAAETALKLCALREALRSA